MPALPLRAARGSFSCFDADSPLNRLRGHQVLCPLCPVTRMGTRAPAGMRRPPAGRVRFLAPDRRDTLPGPGGLVLAIAKPHDASRLDVARGIVIGVRLETTALADKPRTVSVVLVNVPAAGTFATRVCCRYEADQLVAPCRLVGERAVDRAPARLQDRTVEPCLRAGAVRKPLSRRFIETGLRRSRHIPDLKILEHEELGVGCGKPMADLVREVVSRARGIAVLACKAGDQLASIRRTLHRTSNPSLVTLRTDFLAAHAFEHDLLWPELLPVACRDVVVPHVAVDAERDPLEFVVIETVQLVGALVRLAHDDLA